MCIPSFRSPQYEGLEVGVSCLARQEDELWVPATVEEILPDNQTCKVKFIHNGIITDLPLQFILPNNNQGTWDICMNSNYTEITAFNEVGQS